MAEFWLALLGIAGTATSAIVVNAQQNRASRDRAKEDERRRLADLRREAEAGFADVLSNYRRAQLATWHEAHGGDSTVDHDEVPSAAELRQLKSTAWAAFYRVRLLWDDPMIVEHAEELVKHTSQLAKSVDKDGVARQADEIRDRLSDLVDMARRLV